MFTVGFILCVIGAAAFLLAFRWFTRWVDRVDYWQERPYIEREQIRQHEFEMHQLSCSRDVRIANYEHRHPLPSAHYAPHTTYSPTYAPRITNSAAAAQPAPEQAGATLPGMTDLADLDFKPSPGRLLLALGEDGHITVATNKLMHVAFSGATGSGKSNAMRSLLAQLLAIGSRVVLANPIYTDYDHEHDEDWRPVTHRLHMPPAVSADAIDALLSWLIDEELPVRLKRLQDGIEIGDPLVLALDELPMMCDLVPKVTDRVGRLLRMGRHAKIYTAGASQDFLIKTLGGSSGIRDCYRTAYYSGGDIVSAASLLDLKQREIQEGQLGRGVVYLRSSATTPAQLVRVPYASNRAVYQLLGEPAAAETPETVHAAPETPEADFSRAAVVRRMRDSGLGKTEIIRLMWGCSPGGSKAYRQASAEYDDIVNI